MKLQHMLTALMGLALGAQAFWMEGIKRESFAYLYPPEYPPSIGVASLTGNTALGSADQGLAPFGGANYQVFRNVKAFGARGDGVTDDTEAIRAAMNAPNNRCLQGCVSQQSPLSMLRWGKEG